MPDKAQPVSDRPVEKSTMFNNILTAVIVGLLVWVGSSLENIKKSMGMFETSIKLNTREIQRLREDVLENKKDIKNISERGNEFWFNHRSGK